jgi:hypothetical protein
MWVGVQDGPCLRSACGAALDMPNQQTAQAVARGCDAPMSDCMCGRATCAQVNQELDGKLEAQKEPITKVAKEKAVLELEKKMHAALVRRTSLLAPVPCVTTARPALLPAALCMPAAACAAPFGLHWAAWQTSPDRKAPSRPPCFNGC